MNKDGEYGIAFDTTGMIRGYFNSNDTKFGHIAILRDDEQRVEWDTQLSREEVDEDYEGSDDEEVETEMQRQRRKDEEMRMRKRKKEQIIISNNESKSDAKGQMGNNPYLDQSLMKGFQTFSPQQNQKFIATHDVVNENDRNDK